MNLKKIVGIFELGTLDKGSTFKKKEADYSAFIYNVRYLLHIEQMFHHRWHFSSGFILDPFLQPQALANGSKFRSA